MGSSTFNKLIQLSSRDWKAHNGHPISPQPQEGEIWDNFFKRAKAVLWSQSAFFVLYVVLYYLSHTWVRYPGFRAMGLSVQYWPRWFQDFPAIWLAVPLGANGAHLGICTLPEKNLLCVWNKLFLGEIKLSQRRTRPVKSLWWQNVPMQESTNEWENLTIF